MPIVILGFGFYYYHSGLVTLIAQRLIAQKLSNVTRPMYVKQVKQVSNKFGAEIPIGGALTSGENAHV